MFEMTAGMLLSGLVIGGLGFVLFLRGKREREPATLLGGIGLSVLPLGVHSVGLLWLLALGVVGGLVLLRRFGAQGSPAA